MKKHIDNIHSGFRGTYFMHETVFRLSTIAKVMAWLVLGAYIVEWLYPLGNIIYQSLIVQAPLDMKAPGLFQFTLANLSKPALGGLLFMVLYGFSQVLLILLDIEDNIRQVVRQITSSKTK